METAIIQYDYETERGKPMPSKIHAFCQKRILVQLENQYGKLYEPLPELSIVVDGRKKVPDISIYEKGVLNMAREEITVEEMPLAAIEILSPQQYLSDLIEKSLIYLQKGVKSYWLVIPELKSVYVFHQPEAYIVFTQEDVVRDQILDITLDLKHVFF
ncbi:MAG: Uma2 family endonuclease [Bacteroidota bacterium]